MKKIFWCLFFALILSTDITVGVASAKVASAGNLSGNYYYIGIDAFKKGAYDSACSNLEHAVRISPKNVNARYYLAQVYLKQKRTADAQCQYNRIILLAPTSDAAILSEKGLSLIQHPDKKGQYIASNDEMAAYKDNYLDYVLTKDGQIVKWKAFPVRVYIEPKKQNAAVKMAFELWQKRSKNLVSFSYTNSPAAAQIVVTFKSKLEASAGDTGFIAGNSKPYFKNGYMDKSEISILTTDPDTKKNFDDNFICSTALHEIGHSLGFRGHSPNDNDVMAAVNTVAKPDLTQRDLNTLNIFYKIDSKALVARNTGQTDVKLQQALDYIRKLPDKAIGWINLGDIYRNKKMYSEAIKNYQKALTIEPDNAEVYNLLGTTYANLGDGKNAFLNLKKACDLDKSNTSYLAMFVGLCQKTGQNQIGKSYLNSYLSANPKGASDENIQALLKFTGGK